MLNAEAVITLIFGVVVVSVFAFVAFPVLNRNKRIDAVFGTFWNSIPVKGARRMVVRLVVFLLVIWLAYCVYFWWLQWIAYVKQKR